MSWAATSYNNNQLASVVTNRSVTVYPECEWAAIVHGQYAEKDTDIEILMEDNSTQTIPWMAESTPNSTYALDTFKHEMNRSHLTNHKSQHCCQPCMGRIRAE